jgi:hypothetical protein
VFGWEKLGSDVMRGFSGAVAFASTRLPGGKCWRHVWDMCIDIFIYIPYVRIYRIRYVYIEYLRISTTLSIPCLTKDMAGMMTRWHEKKNASVVQPAINHNSIAMQSKNLRVITYNATASGLHFITLIVVASSHVQIKIKRIRKSDVVCAICSSPPSPVIGAGLKSNGVCSTVLLGIGDCGLWLVLMMRVLFRVSLAVESRDDTPNNEAGNIKQT